MAAKVVPAAVSGAEVPAVTHSIVGTVMEGVSSLEAPQFDPMVKAVEQGVSSLDAIEAVTKIVEIASISVPPISFALGPLAVAMGSVVEAAKQVKGNKDEAKMLSDRAFDTGCKMREVVNVCKDLPVERSESVSREIERLTTTLEECTSFLKEFSQRGFFSKLMSGKIDGKMFARFDKKIATHSNELGSALDLQNLMMQERVFAKVEALSALVQHGKPDPNQAAGLVSGLDGDELKAELGEINKKLDNIAEGQTQLLTGQKDLSEGQSKLLTGQKDLSEGQSKILEKLEKMASSGAVSISAPIIPPSGTWAGKITQESGDGYDVGVKHYLTFNEPIIEQGRPMGNISGTEVEDWYRGPARGSIDYSTGVMVLPPRDGLKFSDATIYRRGATGPWLYEYDWKNVGEGTFGSAKLQFTEDTNTEAPPPDDCCGCCG